MGPTPCLRPGRKLKCALVGAVHPEVVGLGARTATSAAGALDPPRPPERPDDMFGVIQARDHKRVHEHPPRRQSTADMTIRRHAFKPRTMPTTRTGRLRGQRVTRPFRVFRVFRGSDLAHDQPETVPNHSAAHPGRWAPGPRGEPPHGREAMAGGGGRRALSTRFSNSSYCGRASVAGGSWAPTATPPEGWNGMPLPGKVCGNCAGAEADPDFFRLFGGGRRIRTFVGR